MPAVDKSVDLDDLRQRHERGESVLSMSRALGIDRGMVTRRLVKMGLEVRSGSEANRLRMAQLSPDERRALAAPANQARRGKVFREAPADRRRALGTADSRSRLVGKGESELADLLVSRGLTVERQVPVYGYNLDITLGRVAVEVWWGEGYPVRHGHQARRAVDLADLGWHVAWVWLSRKLPTGDCVDQLVTFLDIASRSPETVRPQYRVIRGDGELVAGGQLDTDHLALVPPAHR